MKIFKINKNIEVVCDWKKTSYGFKHTATLFVNGQEREDAKCCYYNRTWERYEFESVLEKLAEKTTTLSDNERKLLRAYITDYGKREASDLAPLKAVAMIMTMGDIMGKTQKESNDWKVRMMKAGLKNQGLIMPDDWGTLSEDDKEARLNGAIAQLK